MKRTNPHTKAIRRKAKKGHRGFPVGTIAFYGPDDRRASKVAVGIILVEGGDAEHLKRWFCESGDARSDPSIQKQVFDFLKQHKVRSVVLADSLIGCPHEEGVDYPDGEECQECTFWRGRDRFTGELLQ